jgi:hypothetical protein
MSTDPVPAETTGDPPSRNDFRVCVRMRHGKLGIFTVEQMHQRVAERKRIACSPTPALAKSLSSSSASHATTSPKKKRNIRPDSWTAIRKQLRTWDQPRLLGLIQDLCDTMPEVRAALGARVAASDPQQPAASERLELKQLAKQVAEAITGGGGRQSPRLADAKKIISRYERLSADADGAIALYAQMMFGVINLYEYGDLTDPEMNAMDLAVDRIIEQSGEATDTMLVHDLAERCKRLLQGHALDRWGSDAVIDVVKALEQRLLDLGATRPD